MKTLLLTLLFPLCVMAGEEHDYCEHHEHHEPPVIHEPPAREPVHEVALHRELREREPRDDCHNQWVINNFCKGRNHD